MRKWEIWKSKKYLNSQVPASQKGKLCNKLHHRYATRNEARRVASEMTRQDILCCVRPRVEL